jgi:hypothetical protein
MALATLESKFLQPFRMGAFSSANPARFTPGLAIGLYGREVCGNGWAHKIQPTRGLMSGMRPQEPAISIWALRFTPAPIGLNGSRYQFLEIQMHLLDLLTR